MAGVVVVGGGAGGDAAALSLRRQGYDGRVVLVSDEPALPYERPLLSKELLTGAADEAKLAIRRPEAYDEAGVEVRLGVRVVDALRDQREVVLGTGEQLAYDHLVLATGSRARRLPGMPEAANTLTLRSLDDALTLRGLLDRAQRILVVGAGFLGCEVAASARSRGCRVVLCDVAPAPMAGAIGEHAGAFFARMHREHHVDVRMRTGVAEWRMEDDLVVAAVLTDGTVTETDAVVVAVGAQPDLELARRLGLEETAGGVAVDEQLRAAPRILCAGDAAAHRHPVYGRPIRVEHWRVAQRQGEWCGALIAGATDGPFDDLPWFWSDQYDTQLTQLGWPNAADRMVLRGEPDAHRFSAVSLSGDRVVAVLGVNESRMVRRSRDVIRSGGPLEALGSGDAFAGTPEVVAAR